MYVEITVNGAEQAAEVIDDLVDRLNDRKRFAQTDLAKLLVKSFQDAFSSEGASQGSKWADLSEATIRRDGSHRVLDLSGRLRTSLTSVRGKDTQVSFSGDTLTYGTKVYYGRFVSEKRPFARVADRDVEKIEKALAKFIVDGDKA